MPGTTVTDTQMKSALKQIIPAIPKEWRGTTFNNSNLLGREGFSERLSNLIVKQEKAGKAISTKDLEGVGNAEDYLRVATNISVTLELALAREKGYDVSQVFTFGSSTFPYIAVLMTSKCPVHVFTGDDANPFTAQQLDHLKLLGNELVIHSGPATKQGDHIVLAHESAVKDASVVHGIVAFDVLYITNPTKVAPADILVVRKRMATPVTTPVAEAMLKKLAGMPADPIEKPTDKAVASFYAHLQEMSGTAVNTTYNPEIFTAGLPAICSVWVSLIEQGGADLLMCSTCYGGSSQLTDVVANRAGRLTKHTFHIQGNASIMTSIKMELNKLKENPEKLLPITVLFVEIPTNPDMKVPDVLETASLLKQYKKDTGKEVLLMVDTTFAPASRVMEKIKQADSELPVMVFVSMSKSVSRGLTTAGGIVANHTGFAQTLMAGVSKAAKLLDTNAKDDQMLRLTQNHEGVEDRCQRAYDIAVKVGHTLTEAVKKATHNSMPLAFVSACNAKVGFTSSTFSFNLPAPEGATEEEKEALAQKFVDLLTAHKEFKPCVSFGQDNGLVYATVPATSTQGAIKAEDKAKQAVGGVQLVRLSFPPTVDQAAVDKIISEAVESVYASKRLRRSSRSTSK
eukprot:GFYU01006278.1.p1 GENE.GFYU01006278.1~~GFYU01006278.1.p1  ORF type:complete len:627 (+),score=239.37 GFYU01006278.1:150-2030(+)